MTYKNRKGKSAIPIDRFCVLANPAAMPVMQQYESSMPTIEVKNKGLRPNLSTLKPAYSATTRLNMAVRISKRPTESSNKHTETSVDTGYLDRASESHVSEDRREIADSGQRTCAPKT